MKEKLDLNPKKVPPASVFVIEDEFHCEHEGKFPTFDDALLELKRLAKIPWDQAPNQAPCKSWKMCGRLYMIMKFDTSKKPWDLLDRKKILEVSHEGVRWLIKF